MDFIKNGQKKAKVHISVKGKQCIEFQHFHNLRTLHYCLLYALKHLTIIFKHCHYRLLYVLNPLTIISVHCHYRLVYALKPLKIINVCRHYHLFYTLKLLSILVNIPCGKYANPGYHGRTEQYLKDIPSTWLRGSHFRPGSVRRLLENNNKE